MYLEWLKKRLDRIAVLQHNGLSVPQAFYLSGCDGRLVGDIVLDEQVKNMVDTYNFYPYNNRMAMFFSSIIRIASDNNINVDEVLHESIQSCNALTAEVKDVVEVYKQVQRVTGKSYVFPYISVDPSESLYRAPPGFWKGENMVQYNIDAIYTLYVIAQKNVVLRYKLLRLNPYVTDGKHDESVYDIFNSHRDPVQVTKEKLEQLVYQPSPQASRTRDE